MTGGAEHFRKVAAQFATGVTVVTSMAEDLPVGMTVNSFATVSLDPTLLLICLRYGSRLLSSIERSGVFAATVLAADQQRHARWFASRTKPTGAAAFAGIPTRPGPVTGCLLLGEGLAYFDCRVWTVYPGGDHAVVLGEVAACGELNRRAPLLFAGGGFVAFDPRTAAHGVAPVAAGASAAGAAGAAGAVGAGASTTSGAGRSTSATAWAVTTRR